MSSGERVLDRDSEFILNLHIFRRYHVWKRLCGWSRPISIVSSIWGWSIWRHSNMLAHSMRWQLLYAFEPISPNATCCSGVSLIHSIGLTYESFNLVYFDSPVCLKNLNDYGNAFLAFERSVMLPDAIKNPLIYLNFSIFCWRTKRFELANANLNNFYDLAGGMNVRHEVSSLTTTLILFPT